MQVRFIPAWAGHGVFTPLIDQLSAVHPRVGGARSASTSFSVSRSGSSPRGRGTGSVNISRAVLRRFIPRVGGARMLTWIIDAESCGSSPRGRGTGHNLGQFAQRGRFIPAWAGHGSDRPGQGAPAPVHPRVGGGTVRRPLVRAPVGRFIPAWAGHGSGPSAKSLFNPVHPRVGGARSSSSWPAAGSRGSSPRGRGTGRANTSGMPKRRFIPAWAGHGNVHPTAQPLPSVHPRVGGARLCCWPGSLGCAGSSPRGRGTGVNFWR